jgi:hypothetical protein
LGHNATSAYSITSSASAISLGGNFETHRLGGFQVNDKLKFRGLQYREK